MVKNKIIIALFLILSAISGSSLFSQEKPKDLNFIDRKGKKQGYWKKVDSTGLSYEGQFKDDMPYGRFTYYDKNGNIVSVADFFREGYASQNTFYFPDGTIRAKGFYLDKMRDSVWQIYNEKGKILKEESYENGLLTGLVKTFDSDSNIIETQYWLRGLRNGLWWEKSESGTQTVNYKLNKSHGEYQAHYPSEILYIKGMYDEGLKQGPWQFYDPEGRLEKVMYFKNNILTKKEVAIHVDDTTILLDTDTVAYFYTNGKITIVKCMQGTEYRTRQNFSRLTKAFDTDFFFMANASFMAAYKLFKSMEILPDEGGEPSRPMNSEDDDDVLPPQKAILHLKIPTPFEVIINEEVIAQLSSLQSSKNVGE